MGKCRLSLQSNRPLLKTKLTTIFYGCFRKEVEFGKDGKVLLSRLGDQIHATSAFCTHYGAPLAKGVLTADGRVVW
jgi:nitrite reductase/ring-hydroxylating ferredoxin subunit